MRYRVRVVKGRGNDWRLNYSGTVLPDGSNTAQRLWARGSSVTAVDLGSASSTNPYFSLTPIVHKGLGHYGIYSPENNTDHAHNGLCFAVPIALVPRLNKGAGHPLNTEGCGMWGSTINNDFAFHWYDDDANNNHAKNTVSDCFAGITSNTNALGNIAGGNSGRWNMDGKFHDAIYASDVQDLRMSAKRLPLAEIREKAKRKAIAGEIRGFERVPFTRMILDTTVTNTASFGRLGLADNTGIPPLGNQHRDYWLFNRAQNKLCMLSLVASSSGDITNNNAAGYTLYLRARSTVEINDFNYPDLYTAGNIIPAHTGSSGAANTSAFADVGDAVSLFSLTYKSDHKSANPTRTDIIGSPENIAATFPNGVEGQWIPQIPDGTTKTYKFNRKVTTMHTLVYANDVVTAIDWINLTTPTFDVAPNSVTSPISSTAVWLYNYETQAHFTEEVVWHSELLDLGGVWATNDSDLLDGNLLASTLINKVGTNAGVRSESETPLTTFR
ncbi:MAG: hypothetical protein HRT38_19430, partial [Alteromonadaceae bacterium]|nr:hypothetical protein [Alteromonadaceae bacterium]